MKPTTIVEVNGDRIHLAKDGLGWRVVNPIKNQDGRINIVNFVFGGKQNLVMLIGIFIIFVALFLGVSTMFDSCRHLAENPCDYCATAPKSQLTSNINYIVQNNISLPYQSNDYYK